MEKLNEFRSSTLVYDIFGYLLPGFFFLCLIIIDFDFGSILQYYFEHKHSLSTLTHGTINYKMQYLFRFLTWNTDSEFKFTTLLMLVMFCYLIGHVIAAISSLLFEQFINNKLLGYPSVNLLDNKKRIWFKRVVFESYTKPFADKLSHSFVTKIKERFGDVGDKKSYFWLCFSEISKKHPVAYNRALHFLSLYGFSRNTSMCFILYAVLRGLLSICTHVQATKYNYIIIVLYVLIGIIMFINYLKLYYRQCAELYYHFYALHTDKTHVPASLND